MKRMILWATLMLVAFTNAVASTHNNNESVVTKEYRLSGFTGLRNEHAVTVHYTQGNSYSIKAEGSEQQIERLKIEVKDGVLVVSHEQKDKKGNNEKNTISLYITSPDMNRLENKGVLNFNAESLKTGDFHLTNNGVIHLEVDKLSCKDAECILKGVSNLDVKMDAKSLKINDSGVTKGDIEVKADQLDIDSKGVDDFDVKFKGKGVNVKKSGTGTITLDVDCQHLDVTNSGVGKLAISGTADDTSIQNSGVTKIDVSKLNKF